MTGQKQTLHSGPEPGTLPVVIIVGPTAIGKTAVACALSDLLPKRIELISADSAMVYRGMDIGTAKPGPEELARYPHQLIDIRDPADPYNAADFVADADQCVRRAHALGRVPVIVGGTMLYIKRFLEGMAALPKADQALRNRLKARFDDEGGAQLHAELTAIDPQAAAKIHPHNQQRLLRALEVSLLNPGQRMSQQWQQQAGVGERLNVPLVFAGLLPAQRADLHHRIEQRLARMIELGFIDEVKKLHARSDLHEELPALRSVGYRQAWEYLDGVVTYAEFVANTLTATRRLAKRQLTWMRGWPDMQLVHAPQTAGVAQGLASQIAQYLSD